MFVHWLLDFFEHNPHYASIEAASRDARARSAISHAVETYLRRRIEMKEKRRIMRAVDELVGDR